MKYAALVESYEHLDSTTKRLEKTFYLAALLRNSSVEALPLISLLVQGRVFPTYDERKIGVADKLVLKALQKATGTEEKEIISLWKEKGDLGDTAGELIEGKTQATLFQKALTVEKVFTNIQKLASTEGQGSVEQKIDMMAALLTSATAAEAKYVVRTLLEDLRIGIGDGTLRDAIAWAFLKDCQDLIPQAVDDEFSPSDEERVAYNQCIDAVQHAYDLTNDFGKVAATAKAEDVKGLLAVALTPLIPIKMMLFQKAEDFEDAFTRVGKPAAIEEKYDGFRLQAHKAKNEIRLFTRSFEDVTVQFPDVVEALSTVKADSYILDAEVVGIDQEGKFKPFQEISQRIKRKHGIQEMAKALPVILHVFDLMYLDGKSLLQASYQQRREAIEKIITPSKTITIAAQQLVEQEKDAKAFYDKALAAGNEGVMMKNLEGTYKPGSRVGFGVKIKETMDPLDLVIVEAEWGTGKRSQWLSSFAVACQDEEGNLVTIGEVGTGIKEKKEEGFSFGELTALLEPLITKEEGKRVIVKPEVVVEIKYEEIQRSPSYTSGFALRFPRFSQLRTGDKPVDEIATLQEVEQLFIHQRSQT